MKSAKLKTYLIATTMLLSLSKLGHAGQEGHGGIVVKCGDQIELADFWESKVLHRNDPSFTLNYSEEPVEDQVKKAFDKLAGFRASKVLGLTSEKLYKEFLDIYPNAHSISSQEVYWQFSNDLGLFKKLPENCKLDNVVHYLRSNYIDKREDYYHLLPATEKAALWVHEVVYKITREYGQESSHIARRITSFLFSNLQDKEIAAGLIFGFMSDEKVIFLDRNEVKRKLKLSINHKLPAADNNIVNLFIEGNYITKKSCRTEPRRILGTKQVCTEEQIVSDDFDSFEVDMSVFDMSGTRVKYDLSYSLKFEDKVMLTDKVIFSGVTGQRAKFKDYSSGANYLNLNKKYYVLSETKTFNYIYGR